MVFSALVSAGRTGVTCAAIVLARGLRCVNGLRRGLTSSSLVSLQATLLMLNIFMFTAAKKARKRAEFISAVKCINELDEQSLRLVLGYLPAWVKFSEYEKARFVNDSLQLLWPAFDRAICEKLRAHLEPLLQASAPSAVAGCCFEGLSFGTAPIQIVGIKNNTFRTASEQLGIVLDLDVRWAGQPDITLKLLPSRKWVLKVLPKMKGFDLTPEMHVAFNTLHVAGMLRVTLTPIVQNAPFVGGMTMSWLETPMIDFDVRGLGGADLMSMPAVADWIMASVVSRYVAGMVWPRQISIPFAAPQELEQWLEPIGVIKVEVLEAKLPPRVGSLSRQEKPLNPYAAVVIGTAGPAMGIEAGGNVQSGTTSTIRNQREPKFSEVFYLCVYDAQQVLKIVLAHDMESGNRETDLTLGRVDVPLAELTAPFQLARQSRPSGSVLEASQAHREVRGARNQLYSPRSRRIFRGPRFRSGKGDGGATSSKSCGSQSEEGIGSEEDIGSGGASPRFSQGSSEAGQPAPTSNASWSLVGDGGAGIAAADVDAEEVEDLLNAFGKRPIAPRAVAAMDDGAATSAAVIHSNVIHSASTANVAAVGSHLPLSPTNLTEVPATRSLATPGVTLRARQRANFRMKPRPRRLRRKYYKQHAGSSTANAAAVAAAGPEGVWLPLLSMKSAAGDLQPWSSAIPVSDLPPPDSSLATHHLPKHSSFFPQLAHLSSLLRGPQSLPPATAHAATVVAANGGVAAHVTGDVSSDSQAATVASSRGDSRPNTASIVHVDDTAQQEGADGSSLSQLPPPQDIANGNGLPQPGAESVLGSGISSSTFWDWHKATSHRNPAKRLKGWLTACHEGDPAGRPNDSTPLLESSPDNNENNDNETEPANAANLQPASLSDHDVVSVPQTSKATLGDDAALPSYSVEDSAAAIVPLATAASSAVGSSRKDGMWLPSQWRWRTNHRKRRSSKSKSSVTEDDRDRRGSLDLLTSLLSKVGASSSSGSLGPHQEASKQPGVAYASTKHKADVLGLCKVRLSYHPLGDPTFAPSVAAAASAAAFGDSSPRVGVLLVQLQSAYVASTELTEPSVRLCLNHQIRQSQNFESVQGGRVSWDATSFAFALSIGPSGIAADREITVQLGNLSGSLGDRLWASWFSSSAQYTRATQTLATARISIRPAVEQGSVSGTYHMYELQNASATESSAAPAAVGQISLKFSWRPAQHL